MWNTYYDQSTQQIAPGNRMWAWAQQLKSSTVGIRSESELRTAIVVSKLGASVSWVSVILIVLHQHCSHISHAHKHTRAAACSVRIWPFERLNNPNISLSLLQFNYNQNTNTLLLWIPILISFCPLPFIAHMPIQTAMTERSDSQETQTSKSTSETNALAPTNSFIEVLEGMSLDTGKWPQLFFRFYPKY